MLKGMKGPKTEWEADSAALERVMMGVMASFIVLFTWPLSRCSVLFFQGPLSSPGAGEQQLEKAAGPRQLPCPPCVPGWRNEHGAEMT